MPTRSLASVIPDEDDDTAPQSATSAPAEAAPAQDTNTTAAPAQKRRRAPARSSKPRTTATPPAATPAPAAAEPAPEQRTGRPRIPKAGPVTRVTVDLAVTEQAAIDKLTATIGREIGRGQGKNKIYPQHLMRVAIRRLLTDDAFRREITADLAEGRDALKRIQKP